MKEKKKVLEDHKREKKKLIPPMLTVGNFKETSYVDLIIPEIIWLAILNRKYGIQKGAELGLELVQISSKVSTEPLFFAFISSFEFIDDLQKQKIKDELMKNKSLELIQATLANFCRVYPNCPLNFLANVSSENPTDIAAIKEMLDCLYDKRSRDSTFMMGNVIYYLFCLDRLKVTENTSLSRLPELREYPDTEISKRIASSIRAAMHTFIQPPFYYTSNKWNRYFWNRGLELEPCYI